MPTESTAVPEEKKSADDAAPPAPAPAPRKGDEGVEVVLGESGATSVVDTPTRSSESIFRGAPVARPRAMRAPYYASGSWGYPYGGYPPPHSFDEGYHPPPYSSPHVQYPPPRGYGEDVNVISPSHKPEGGPYRPPMTPRPRHYHYPPTSPVSRPAEPPRRYRNAYSRAQRTDYYAPPTVVQDSFDSSHAGAPPPPPPPPPHDPYYQFYGGGGSWGSFDSAPPPPHDYYGMESAPYSPYHGYPPPHEAGSMYPHSFSYDEGEFYDQKHVTPPGSAAAKRSQTPVASNKTLLPAAASEIDFEVTNPPAEPVVPPGTTPVCESLADVNAYDVLCGRGGGTNSQIGNRRFRKLVQEFQPTYLEAKRKEKPLLARTIVLIIRQRGGHFLKKNEETGELLEVGDIKAEAKTSQALREGLDVRNTRASEKQKKKKPKAESPPTLPHLAEAPPKHPHSPEQASFRKRRRMRSNDRFFPDFCPPRADLKSMVDDDDDHDDDNVVEESVPAQGCAGIAMDLVTGAATGSFCLGPTGWRR